MTAVARPFIYDHNAGRLQRVGHGVECPCPDTDPIGAGRFHIPNGVYAYARLVGKRLLIHPDKGSGGSNLVPRDWQCCLLKIASWIKYTISC